MSDDDDFQAYLKWRKGFVLKLALFHFFLILVFDVMAIYAPGIMTRPLTGDSAFTIGLLFSLGIVFSVIGSTFYYSHRINREEVSVKGMST